MKALTGIAILAATLALSSGCCTTTLCREGGRATCYIQNDGWFLFGVLPIASGDPKAPNCWNSRWFRDTVTLDTNIKLLDKMMKDNSYTKSRSLASYSTHEDVFFILLRRRSYHTSAEFLK